MSLFYIQNLFEFPKEALPFLWYLCEAYTIGIMFRANELVYYLLIAEKQARAMKSDRYMHCYKFLAWFKPNSQWVEELHPCYANHVIIKFHRPISRTKDKLTHHPITNITVLKYNPHFILDHIDWGIFRTDIARENNISIGAIPDSVLLEEDLWPKGDPVCAALIKLLNDHTKAKRILDSYNCPCGKCYLTNGCCYSDADTSN